MGGRASNPLTSPAETMRWRIAPGDEGEQSGTSTEAFTVTACRSRNRFGDRRFRSTARDGGEAHWDNGQWCIMPTGGGGGSGYAAMGLRDVLHTQGYRSGNGRIAFSWRPSPPQRVSALDFPDPVAVPDNNPGSGLYQNRIFATGTGANGHAANIATASWQPGAPPVGSAGGAPVNAAIGDTTFPSEDTVGTATEPVAQGR